MSLNFNGINIGGTNGGGGGTPYVLPVATTTTLGGVKIDGETITIEDGVISAETTPITIDATLSNSSTNPVQNKVLYPSLSGFIPDGTTFNINADGTGDFETLPDAISYLIGKWSNGTVTIQLGDGTFTIASRIYIQGNQYNIPRINIVGNGTSNTTIQSTISNNNPILTITNNASLVRIANLSMIHNSGTKSTDYRAINVIYGAEAVIENITFTGLTRLNVGQGGKLQLWGTNTFNTCNQCIYVTTASAISDYDATVTCNDVTEIFHIVNGGTFHGYGLNVNKTSVTSVSNLTSNTASNNGWITGVIVS